MKVLIHEMFELSDEKAAKLYARMVKYIINKTPEIEIIKDCENLSRKELGFILYMLGWIGGAYSHYKGLNFYPELEFMGRLIVLYKTKGEKEVEEFVLNRIKTVRTQMETERLRDSV